MRSSFRLSFGITVLMVLAGVRVFAGDMGDADKHALACLRQLGNGCLIYASQNKGWLPDKFAKIAPFMRSPEPFLDPRLHTPIPGDWDKLSPEQKADWVDKNCEFDFTSIAGLRINKLKNVVQTPLITSRPKDGVTPATLFADGHAELGKQPTTAPATQP